MKLYKSLRNDHISAFVLLWLRSSTPHLLPSLPLKETPPEQTSLTPLPSLVGDTEIMNWDKNNLLETSVR